jgi:hypothetical protein
MNPAIIAFGIVLMVSMSDRQRSDRGSKRGAA